MSLVDLSVDLAGIRLANPVMNASGTVSLDTAEVVDLSAFGALVTKGVTLESRPGNPVPRLCETPCGMINSIGLENLGLEAFMRDELPKWLSFGPPVIVNISGSDPNEYHFLAKELSGTGISGIEVNVSCPNRDKVIIGTDPRLTILTILRVRDATSLPIIVKLTPNVTDIGLIAESAVGAKANALSLVNTFLAMDMDIETAKPKIGKGFGGLSGPAILPQALFKVWQACQKVDVPVIGMGGISCTEDAIKFFMAGAKAVAIGTACFSRPNVISEVVSGLQGYLIRKGYNGISEIPRIDL